MNISALTNAIALILLFLGYISPVFQSQLKAIGIFALSGALTNWLAVHMLFEKVPFLYGSGIIPLKFKEFKKGIRTLIMERFFTVENINKVIQNHSIVFPKESILNSINYDKLFLYMSAAIEESSLGSMLQMVGGTKALEPVREPLQNKLREYIETELLDDSFWQNINQMMSKGVDVNHWQESVQQIVEKRLEELTPKQVKDIIQEMIKSHLGWLVVWGGVFGGFIGFISSLVAL